MQPGVSAHHAAQKLDFRRLAFRTGWRRRLTRASRRAPEQSRHCRASSRARAVDVAVRWQLTVREPVRAIGHCPLALQSWRHHPAISAIGSTRWPPKRQIRWFYSRSVRIRTGRRPPSSEIDIGAEKGNSAMGRRRKPDHIMSRTRIGHTVAPVGLQNLAPFPKSTI
jgi:hypothetical protein